MNSPIYPSVRLSRFAAIVCATALVIAISTSGSAGDIAFTEVANTAGLDYLHDSFDGVDASKEHRIFGGVAAGDYDRDGWVDLYVVGGGAAPNALFRNRGDGTFEDLAAVAGVAVDGELGTGPVFADWTGDGWPDLLINGINGTQVRLFENLADGRFKEVTATSGITLNRSSFSGAFADYDLDGDLDLALARWERDPPCTSPCTGHLWRNDGDGLFVDVDLISGIEGYDSADHTFTPNFADVDNDGWSDLLMASDFGTSRVFLNQRDATFTDITDPLVVTDSNGMGASIGDYDNDGDLDWFITSIYSAPPISDGSKTGNRLYRNSGAGGAFEEVSEAAGVRIGYWGWGSCFADFDNDGHLDIFHVNGWRNGISGDWSEDPSRFFVSQGPPDWDFVERSADFGLVDTDQGRGIVCFDYDRDGDVDILIANNHQPLTLWRNEGSGGQAGDFLAIRLRDSGSIPTAVGARIYVTTGETTQMREVQAGSNFQSQQPLVAHFGLGAATTVDEILVSWSDGTTEAHTQMEGGPIDVGQALGIGRGQAPCVLRRGLSGNLASGAYEACSALRNEGATVVSTGTSTVLRAGMLVELSDGFEVLEDGQLTVEVDEQIRIP